MVCPPATSEAGIMSAKVVSCSNINGYLRNYQDCLTLAKTQVLIIFVREHGVHAGPKDYFVVVVVVVVIRGFV
jgi:hypothetical protein